MFVELGRVNTTPNLILSLINNFILIVFNLYLLYNI